MVARRARRGALLLVCSMLCHCTSRPAVQGGAQQARGGRDDSAASQQRSDRFVIDFDARCHNGPSLSAATGSALRIASHVVTDRKVQAEGATWHSLGSAQTPCWIYGPNTIESDPNNPVSSWMAMVDHQLARKDVRFVQYVQLDNLLSETSGQLDFKLLQLLDQVLSGSEGTREAIGADPLKQAWVRSHSSLVSYFDPSGQWSVLTKPYWDVYERSKGESWTEEFAWFASQHGPGTDECYSDCVLSVKIIQGPLQYWSRFPTGVHIAEAIQQGAEFAKYAASMACYEKDESPVPKDLVEHIRTSLVPVVHLGKQDILKSLDEAERACRR
jgi:hypothetical protein